MLAEFPAIQEAGGGLSFWHPTRRNAVRASIRRAIRRGEKRCEETVWSQCQLRRMNGIISSDFNSQTHRAHGALGSAVGRMDRPEKGDAMRRKFLLLLSALLLALMVSPLRAIDQCDITYDACWESCHSVQGPDWGGGNAQTRCQIRCAQEWWECNNVY